MMLVMMVVMMMVMLMVMMGMLLKAVMKNDMIVGVSRDGARSSFPPSPSRAQGHGPDLT